MHLLRFICSTFFLGYIFILKVNGVVDWLDPPEPKYEFAANTAITIGATFNGSSIWSPAWYYLDTPSTRIKVSGTTVLTTVYCDPASCTLEDSTDTDVRRYYLTINDANRDFHNGSWEIEHTDADPQSLPASVLLGVNIEEVIMLVYGEEVEDAEMIEDAKVTDMHTLTCTTSNADPPPTIQWFIGTEEQTSATTVHHTNADDQTTYDTTSTFLFQPESIHAGQAADVTCTASQELLDPSKSRKVTFIFSTDKEDGGCGLLCIILIICGILVVSGTIGGIVYFKHRSDIKNRPQVDNQEGNLKEGGDQPSNPREEVNKPNKKDEVV